jgi:hypothetical protein
MKVKEDTDNSYYRLSFVLNREGLTKLNFFITMFYYDQMTNITEYLIPQNNYENWEQISFPRVPPSCIGKSFYLGQRVL